MATAAAHQVSLEASEARVGAIDVAEVSLSRGLWFARRAGGFAGVAAVGASLALVVLPPVLIVGGIAAGWVSVPVGLGAIALKDAALAVAIVRLWSGPLDPLRERIGHVIEASCAALALEPPLRGARRPLHPH